MTLHRYRTLDRQGNTAETAIEAPSDADAREQLRRRGLIPVRALGDAATSGGRWYRPEPRFNLYSFTNRLSPLLDANLPLERVLAVIEEGAEPADLPTVRKLRQGLHEGKSFSSLARSMPRFFPPLYCALLETGEESGCLPEVARELRRFLHEDREFRNFVVSSSIYPGIVISVTLLVVVLLFTVFIPRFAKIFEDMGRELPMLTSVMLKIGNFMQAIWWIWPLLIAGLIYGARVFRRSEKAQAARDRTLLKLPLLSGIAQSVQIGYFLRTLSIMMKNHVHLLPAVRISRQVVANRVIAESLSPLEDRLRGGGRLSAVLADNRFMPPGSVAMLRIAEESGELGEMLGRVAAEVESDTRLRVKRLLTLLEPLIIILLALIVLAVVLSIFLAILKMNVIQ